MKFTVHMITVSPGPSYGDLLYQPDTLLSPHPHSAVMEYSETCDIERCFTDDEEGSHSPFSETSQPLEHCQYQWLLQENGIHRVIGMQVVAEPHERRLHCMASSLKTQELFLLELYKITCTSRDMTHR